MYRYIAPMFGVSKKVRVALVCVLLPFVFFGEDTHVPLKKVREAPPRTPPLGPGGSYDPVALPEDEAEGATVTLRYAFEPLPGVDHALEHPVALDPATKQWVREQFAHRLPLWFMVSHGLVKLFAYKWVAGALFSHPELYLLSPSHWEELLRPFLGDGAEDSPLRALDIGAGTGFVTAGYASLFDKVVATEVALPYVWRLQQRGYDAYRTETVSPENLGGQSDFDVVFALNVLDRHARPFRLLSEIASVLRPRGVVVLSMPLPVTQHDAARYMPMLQSAPQPLGLRAGQAPLGKEDGDGEGSGTTEDEVAAVSGWEVAAAEVSCHHQPPRYVPPTLVFL